MKKWTRWQDWVAVAAGLYGALATLWTTQTAGSTSLMIIFGVLLIVAGLWNLSAPGQPMVEWAQAILAALLFVSPWLAAYAGTMDAAWSSWIAGGVGVIVTATVIQPTTSAHHRRIRPSH